MKRRAFALAPLGCLLLAAGLLADQPAQQQPPTDWIDPATGHRVIRLSPDGGGSSLYFHQNTYTPEGDKLIFNSKGGIVAVDLPQLERMFGDKIKLGIALTLEEEASAKKEDNLAKRLANPTSMAFVFTDLKSGESKTVGYQYAWLNHLQFSPTDPNLLLYCHEGTWHEVDRVWVIRTDGSGQKLLHKRTMDMEIAGHEFWSYDGKMVWYDLQTPRSKEFWLAGVNLETGEKVRYKIERDHWSIHYNVS